MFCLYVVVKNSDLLYCLFFLYVDNECVYQNDVGLDGIVEFSLLCLLGIWFCIFVDILGVNLLILVMILFFFE